MFEHKQLILDAKDRLRSEIDIELRKYRRRLRAAGETYIEGVTKDPTLSFDPNMIAKRAITAAKKTVVAEQQKQIEGPKDA